MALIKQIEHQVTVLADGQLQIREDTIILDEGIEISRIFHRKTIDVGSDVTSEPQIIRDLAQTVHTPERIVARRKIKK